MQEQRLSVCLNGIWEKSEGGDPTSVPKDGWTPVRVPEEFGNWERESVWYRLQFRIPSQFEGSRAQLEIGRIRFYGKALINGRPCGESWQPRMPLMADITDLIHPGGTNELHVFAHCLAEGYSNPGEPLTDAGARGALLDYYDTHDQAAVMGDVFVRCTPKIEITDLQIIPSVQKMDLTVRARISNGSAAPFTGLLQGAVKLHGENVLTIDAMPLEIAGLAEAEVVLSASWSDPVFWGPRPHGEPVLYHLQTELVNEEEALEDRRYDRFGFRELWTEGDRFVLNGKPIFMMGTHISGFEMREAMTLLVPKLQQAGFLFVHPHADNRLDSFYDVCDELGMMVWDCTYCGGPIGNRFNAWGSDSKAALELALPHLEPTYERWIERNRNHPSIVLWSAGCNNHSIHGPLNKIIQNRDPSTRPVVTYDDPQTQREVFMLGFTGWGHGEPDFAGGIQNIDKAKERRGDRSYPLFIGEYWSRSGIPGSMEVTFDEGVAGGSSFDVGGYRGCLPPMGNEFEISWPSESGLGQRRRNLILRGHKITFPENRHPNWSDPSQPVYLQDWVEEPGYRDVAMKAYGGVEPATVRVPEVIVTVNRNGSPVPHENVILYPEEGQSVVPCGVMTDLEGRAWFVLREPGRYRAVCAENETTFTTTLQPLKLEAGYDYVQYVDISKE
jgi:hypothetical protein